MGNNDDSDDEYVAKDRRSKLEVLKDCKVQFVNNTEVHTVTLTLTL